MEYGGVVSEVKPAICGERFVMRHIETDKNVYVCVCVRACVRACVCVCVWGGGGLRQRVEGVDTEADTERH